MSSLDIHLGALGWVAKYIIPNSTTILLLNIALTCAALTWLVHRSWQVLRIPLPELIDKLGLEVPCAPEVSLAGIESNSITLHWNGPDKPSAIARYLIKVNGITVGESSRSEMAITVSGLKPDHFYGVRVVAVNAGNFQTASGIVRLKTLGQDGQGADDTATVGLRTCSGHDPRKSTVADAANFTDIPAVRPQGHLAELASHNATTSIRDQRGGHHPGRKLASGRRSLPSNPAIDHPPLSPTAANGQAPAEAGENGPTIAELTEKLEVIRRDTEDVQAVKSKEEEEFQAARDALITERDRLKRALKEKDDASAELRREVANLERQNRTVQSNKTAKEKLLHQKQNERLKLRQEMDRWNKESVEYSKETEKLERQKIELLKATEDRAKEIRERIKEWQKSIKDMEEDIRLKGARIKKFEQERIELQTEEGDSEALDRENRIREDDSKWEIRFREMQVTYSKLSAAVQQAQESYRYVQDRLAWWSARGITRPVQFSNMSAQDLELLVSNKLKQRRSRHNKSRSSMRPSIGGDGFSNETRYSSPTPQPVSPFISIVNGTGNQIATDHAGTSKDDHDQLTAGAPMSPTADALLPSNLLGDEEMPNPRMGSLVGSLNTNPAFGANSFTGLGPLAMDPFFLDPNSPDSAGSKAPSIFSSPKSSLHHLPIYHAGADTPAESDQAPLGRNFGAVGDGANSAATGSRRLANLFSLNLSRQRGKTLGTEPPALGALKPGQSQSFPRNWETLSGELDPIGTKRRKGSHSTSWIGPMANFNFLNRSVPDSREENLDTSAKLLAGRRKPFHMFGSKVSPLNVPNIIGSTTAPRPSSVSSFDNVLPRPSSDSQPFGWPVQRTGQPGPDWSVRSNEPWSHGPSRRGSAQYGSTSSLSLGTDPHVKMLSPDTPHPAPIGTRPMSSPRSVGAGLNPAAPSFKTLFSRTEAKKAEKAEKVEKAAELVREKAKERERDKDFELINEEASSTGKRYSRDTRSIHTEESLADSRDSMDRPASATASESATPSSSSNKDKESIFQKISRKSSAGMFNVPWKDRSIRSNKKTAEPSTPGELDDDSGGGGMDSQLGKSIESATSSPSVPGGRSGLSWSHLMRKPKVDDKAAADATDRTKEPGGDDSGSTMASS